MKTGWAVCIHFVSSQIVYGHVSHRRTELLLLSIACPSRVYGMLIKVSKDFTFFVKAHRELIHVRKKAQETLPRFHEMLKAYHRKYPYFDGPHGNSSSSVGCGDCTELL